MNIQATSAVLERTNFKLLGARSEGKVRDIYMQSDRAILVSTDRHSSFDRRIGLIPGKGEILNRMSAWWFAVVGEIVPNHVIAIPDPNVTVARRCKPLPIEAVVRGYLTGVTGTSLWTLYSKGQRDFGSFVLPDGMVKNQRLPKPVFTPTTKEDAHDRPMTPREIVASGLLSNNVLSQVENASQSLFGFGRNMADMRGFILADAKYEFGMDAAGKLTLIDEIHTPDCSRWWLKRNYLERFRAGAEPDYYDKEYGRQWMIERCDPYASDAPPELPASVVAEMAGRYRKVFHAVTGGVPTVPQSAEAMMKRIRTNLASYLLD